MSPNVVYTPLRSIRRYSTSILTTRVVLRLYVNDSSGKTSVMLFRHLSYFLGPIATT